MARRISLYRLVSVLIVCMHALLVTGGCVLPDFPSNVDCYLGESDTSCNSTSLSVGTELDSSDKLSVSCDQGFSPKYDAGYVCLYFGPGQGFTVNPTLGDDACQGSVLSFVKCPEGETLKYNVLQGENTAYIYDIPIQAVDGRGQAVGYNFEGIDLSIPGTLEFNDQTRFGIHVQAVVSAENTTLRCSFVIQVVDQHPPIVTCPSDILKKTQGIKISVEWLQPIAKDNVDLRPLYVSRPNSSDFYVGNDSVTVVAYDSSGNMASCTFAVVVQHYKVQCNNVIVPEHGTLICGDADNGFEMCFLYCEEGYQPGRGHDVLRCIEGQWFPKMDLRCVRREPSPRSEQTPKPPSVQCNNVIVPGHGTLIYRETEDGLEMCLLYCEVGYEPYKGQDILACIEGQWFPNIDLRCVRTVPSPSSDQIPKPMSVECTNVIMPEHGILICGEAEDGLETCLLYCETGYKRYRGQNVMKCIDGQWSPEFGFRCLRRVPGQSPSSNQTPNFSLDNGCDASQRVVLNLMEDIRQQLFDQNQCNSYGLSVCEEDFTTWYC